MESSTTKQQLLLVFTRKCSCLKTPTGSAILVNAPEGQGVGARVEPRVTWGTGSAQQCLALGSCWLFTGQGKEKSQSSIWYIGILGSFIRPS